jgi:hypothetical protein
VTQPHISSDLPSLLSHLEGVGGKSFLMCVKSCTVPRTRGSARDLNSGRVAVKKPWTVQYVTWAIDDLEGGYIVNKRGEGGGTGEESRVKVRVFYL